MSMRAWQGLLIVIAFGTSPARAQVPPAPIVGVDTRTAAFVGMTQFGPTDTPIPVTDYEDFVTRFGASTADLANPYLAPSVAGFFANGGVGLTIVRVADGSDASLIGTDGGPGARTGLQSLLDVDEVSVVAIPGCSSMAVQTALIAHCEQLGDRLAILDPAANADVTAVLAQRASLASQFGFAALYFPWVQAAPTGVSLALPPSGFVAGIMTRTDPPDSPVDLVATATGVTYAVSTAQQDLLNPQGINAIRFFSGQGVRVWGARTIATDPEWIYVPVRRVRLYLEESIQEGTQWAVFEENEPSLWTALRAVVEDFLYARYLDGWFPGTRPDDAFFVRCDLSTMTQADLDEGRTVVLVGYAPVRPSEFVLFRVVHQRHEPTATFPVLPMRLALHPARPNPFNARTEIRFSLPLASAVDLSVFDVTGRVVDRLLVGERKEAGDHQVVWTATDLRGRPVASGVYRVRLRAAGAERTAKIVLIE